MLTKDIKNKINELFTNKTGTVVGVSFGKKITGGQYTNEHSIVFSVSKKLPLNQVPSNEVIPATIDINGVTYSTDVVQVGKVRAITCDSSCIPASLGGSGATPSNQNMIRPLQGGVSIGSQNTAIYVDGSLYEWFIGTMGLIAVDVETQALVGVTNNHVVVQDAFYTTDRDPNGPIENEGFDTVYQDGETGPDPSKAVGQVVRYNPLTLTGNNQADVAIFSLNPAFVSMTQSYYIYGLTGQPGALPFATTSDIDNLLSTNPAIYSSGRTTGVKEGICQLAISSVGVSIGVDGYQLQGNTQSVTFTDLIQFTRQDPSCSFPIYSGDSGSALIADFGGGVWKIIGLVFAGDDSYNGFACRIDEVASQVSIQAWDGTVKNIIDPTTISYATVNGATDSKSFIVGSQSYWQVGLTTSSIEISYQYTLAFGDSTYNSCNNGLSGNVSSTGSYWGTQSSFSDITSGNILYTDSLLTTPISVAGYYSNIHNDPIYQYPNDGSALNIDGSGNVLGINSCYVPCLVKGTKVLLSNGEYKNIEDVEYSDELRVWNFDEGKFDSANPLWIKVPQLHRGHNLIKFSDGSELKTLQTELGHRIFNIEKGMFTYPMTDDTPIGTTTFNENGETVTLVSKEIVDEVVEYYNIVTDKHINIFANTILTSCRYNNIYPIKDMKFVKDGRKLRSREEFEKISDRYFEGFRLSEQSFPLSEIESYMEEKRYLDSIVDELLDCFK
jgi:hypothetical protein